MNQRVVTELVIDAKGAVAGTAEYERAMAKAGAAVEKVKQKSQDLRLDSNLPRSVDRVSQAFDKLRASIDPVTRAEQRASTEMRRSMALVDRAVMTGVATQQQGAAVISALRQKQIAEINQVREAQVRLNSTPVAPAGASAGATGMVGAAGAVGGLRGVLGPLAGVLSGREVMGYADAWTEAGNKIRAVSEITGVQTRSVSDLNDIATQTRSGLTETVTLYARLVQAASGVAKSEQEIADATEIVNKAFKAGGASASEQAAGILQLSQALGSGLLQGDELRSLRENAPLIAKAIADEFNTTIGGLKQLGADGMLTADRVFKAILKGQSEINAAYAATNATLSDGWKALSNQAQETIGKIDQATGFTSQFTIELNNLASAIDNVTDNPNLDNFLNIFNIKLVEGGLADNIRDSFNTMAADGGRNLQALQAEIDITKQKIKELESGLAGGAFNFFEISNAKEDLRALNEELDRISINGHSALVSLHRSAEDASMKALEAFRKVSVGVQSIPDKTVTINVRTVYDTPSGGQVGVTRGYAGPGGLAPQGYSGPGFNTLDQDPNYLLGPALSGKRAAGGPVSAGGTYLVGEKGPEIVTMAGAGNVSSASATAGLLAGGRDKLAMVEENTFQTVEEIRRSVGYFETMVKDGQTSLSLLRAIQSAIGASQIKTGSSGGFSSSGGGSSGGYSSGGFSSGGGGYSSRDARSPYYYSGVTQPGGAQYDPLADLMYNGNRGALSQIAGSGYSMYEATPANNPFYVNRNRFQSNADIARMLGRQGPSVGAYGGGINITAESDWIDRTGFFGSGFRGGFATGGIIHPGDTQKVEFFKNPNERVIIARPDQYEDQRSGGKAASKTVNLTVNMPRSGPVTTETRRADKELADRFRQAVRAELGGL